MKKCIIMDLYALRLKATYVEKRRKAQCYAENPMQ